MHHSIVALLCVSTFVTCALSFAYTGLMLWFLSRVTMYVRVSPDTSSFSAPVWASGRGFRKSGVAYVQVLHIATRRSQQVPKS